MFFLAARVRLRKRLRSLNRLRLWQQTERWPTRCVFHWRGCTSPVLHSCQVVSDKTAAHSESDAPAATNREAAQTMWFPPTKLHLLPGGCWHNGCASWIGKTGRIRRRGSPHDVFSICISHVLPCCQVASYKTAAHSASDVVCSEEARSWKVLQFILCFSVFWPKSDSEVFHSACFDLRWLHVLARGQDCLATMPELTVTEISQIRSARVTVGKKLRNPDKKLFKDSQACSQTPQRRSWKFWMKQPHVTCRITRMDLSGTYKFQTYHGPGLMLMSFKCTTPR